jgi:hypothetical protein
LKISLLFVNLPLNLNLATATARKDAHDVSFTLPVDSLEVFSFAALAVVAFIPLAHQKPQEAVKMVSIANPTHAGQSADNSKYS